MSRLTNARWLTVSGATIILLTACGGAPSTPSTAPTDGPPSARPAAGQPWIIFEAMEAPGEAEGNDRLFLVHPDGSGEHEITADLPGDRFHGRWTPDGRRIVFGADADPNDTVYGEMYIADADGSNIRRLGTCEAPCIGLFQPSVAPDGTRIAFNQTDGPEVQIGGTTWSSRQKLIVADLGPDGISNPTVLIDNAGTNEIWLPRWSPDGQTILLWQDQIDGTGEVSGAAVFTIGADGTNLTQLTPWDLAGGDGQWSPDGSKVVFTTHPHDAFESASSHLYTMQSDGTSLTQLTASSDPGARALYPHWTPDGRILYNQQSPGVLEIWTMSGDGTSAGVLLPSAHDATEHQLRFDPDWQPSADE